MNKSSTKIRAFCATALMIIGLASASAGDNILRNPKFADQGKFWNLRYNNLQDSIQKEKGKPCIRMEMAAADEKGSNVLTQAVSRPQGGNYIYSVEVLPSRKFKTARVMLMYRGNDGEMVYLYSRTKSSELKPGEWSRLVGEAKIPADKTVTFAVEIRDPKAEGYILIRDPQMTLREE